MNETTLTTGRPPLVIAHRGASFDAPENTLAAFELAVDQGADGIELDVHLSRDDQPVVIHDFTLERTTDGAGPVRDRTAQELKRLDAGSWRDRRFGGQRVQTLQEVVERFKERARFWIELKGGSDFYSGIEERVLSVVEIYDVVDRTLVQSFDHAALSRLRSMNREVRLGALVESLQWDPAVVAGGVAQAVCPGVHALTAADAAAIARAGLECYVWTVNEPAEMDRLAAWGVSGIITDRPAVLRARLRRQRD